MSIQASEMDRQCLGQLGFAGCREADMNQPAVDGVSASLNEPHVRDSINEASSTTAGKCDVGGELSCIETLSGRSSQSNQNLEPLQRKSASLLEFVVELRYQVVVRLEESTECLDSWVVQCVVFCGSLVQHGTKVSSSKVSADESILCQRVESGIPIRFGTEGGFGCSNIFAGPRSSSRWQ